MKHGAYGNSLFHEYNPNFNPNANPNLNPNLNPNSNMNPKPNRDPNPKVIFLETSEFGVIIFCEFHGRYNSTNQHTNHSRGLWPVWV